MTWRRPSLLRSTLCCLLVAWLSACAGSRAGGPPSLPPADLRVAFVGNSLTTTHDVPGLVQAMADRAGKSMSHVTIAGGNRSLEDHWQAGLPETLRRLGPDVVVMQQGPSTLPRNREHLVQWSTRIAAVTREAGGEAALYMVWPPAGRPAAFEAAMASYLEAARAAGARVLPAALTWVEIWRREPDAALYGSDGFHPSYLGALAAAQTVYAVLFDARPDSVPALDDDIPPALRQRLAEALAASLESAGERP